MRLLVGIILGGILTVGGAYLYDSRHNLTAAAGTTQEESRAERPLVNWDVVATKLDVLAERARREWNRLAG